MTDVVVGVDGSEHSVAALQWAAAYARLMGHSVRAITAWQYPAIADATGMVTMPGPDVLIESAEAVLELAIEQAQLDPQVKVVREIVEGHPARILLDRSATASALVVGRRGHGGFVGLLTGSVATSCANHAEVPVVIVP
jgi:nucleotide-binding universal stress UspA family protein